MRFCVVSDTILAALCFLDRILVFTGLVVSDLAEALDLAGSVDRDLDRCQRSAVFVQRHRSAVHRFQREFEDVAFLPVAAGQFLRYENLFFGRFESVGDRQAFLVAVKDRLLDLKCTVGVLNDRDSDIVRCRIVGHAVRAAPGLGDRVGVGARKHVLDLAEALGVVNVGIRHGDFHLLLAVLGVLRHRRSIRLAVRIGRGLRFQCEFELIVVLPLAAFQFLLHFKFSRNRYVSVRDADLDVAVGDHEGVRRRVAVFRVRVALEKQALAGIVCRDRYDRLVILGVVSDLDRPGAGRFLAAYRRLGLSQRIGAARQVHEGQLAQSVCRQ